MTQMTSHSSEVKPMETDLVSEGAITKLINGMGLPISKQAFRQFIRPMLEDLGYTRTLLTLGYGAGNRYEYAYVYERWLAKAILNYMAERETNGPRQGQRHDRDLLREAVLAEKWNALNRIIKEVNA